MPQFFHEINLTKLNKPNLAKLASWNDRMKGEFNISKSINVLCKTYEIALFIITKQSYISNFIWLNLIIYHLSGLKRKDDLTISADKEKMLTLNIKLSGVES